MTDDDALPRLPWIAMQNQNGVTCMWDAKGFRVRAKGQIAHEIVRRVNLHDELLAACKCAREACITVMGECKQPSQEGIVSWAQDAFDLLEKAIAKAEAK